MIIDGPGHHWGRNDEFCVSTGPVTRTADMLRKSVKPAIWLIWSHANLFGVNPHPSTSAKCCKGDKLPRKQTFTVFAKKSLFA